MRCFVTGACGFIGSHLVETLVAEGHDVTGLALYNPSQSWGWLEGIEARKAHGDVRDAEQMRRLIKGHEAVFHLAAQIEVPYSFVAPRSFIDTNVTGTLNVLEACRATGAKLIHTSSSEVYGTAAYTPQDEAHPLQAQSPYAASKIAADALVTSYHRSYDLPAVILRPFNTYGPRQSERAVIASIILQDLRDGAVTLGDLRPHRDFLYVEDTVRAFMAVMKLSGGVYNAGTGISISIKDLAAKIITYAAAQGEYRPENAEVHLLRASSAKLFAETGWRPRVSLDEGLKRTKEWWHDSVSRS